MNNNNMDEELNIFTEDDWDFISQETANEFENFEYFSDVKDINLEDNTTTHKIVTIALIASVSLLMLILIAVFIKSMTSTGSATSEISSINNMTPSDVQGVTLDYVEGKEVDNKVLAKTSETINTYFNILGTGKDYDLLKNQCADGGSTVGTTEKTYQSAIEYSYDYNDCYARCIRGFGKQIKLSRVDKVLESDGQYYCYITLDVPHYYKYSDYFGKYSSDMRQFFTQESINTIGVSKYIIRVFGFNDMPLTKSQYLLRLDKNCKIIDDSSILEVCNNAYTTSVNQITSKLGSSVSLAK